MVPATVVARGTYGDVVRIELDGVVCYGVDSYQRSGISCVPR